MNTWSKSWKASKQPKKQRKYRYEAPLHIKQHFFGAHLSKELRQKYNRRSIVVVKEDKVKVIAGQFKGHTGKIEKVNLRKTKVFVSGIEISKKDGSKALYPIHPSNIIIIELNLNDKKRVSMLDRKKIVKEEKQTSKK